MLTNNRWIPENLRPSIYHDDCVIEDFLATWVAKEYKEDMVSCFGKEFTLDDVKQSGIYESIFNEWNGDDEYAAERLIKWHGWTFSQAQEFTEKSLSYDIDKEQERLETEWIKENGYTLPFEIGSRVQTENGKQGVIQSKRMNHYLPKGEALVLTDEQAKENKQWEKEGSSCRVTGTVCNWEDLNLIEE